VSKPKAMNMMLKGKIIQMFVRLMTVAAMTGVAETITPSVRK
jgi:hypothetical protein